MPLQFLHCSKTSIWKLKQKISSFNKIWECLTYKCWGGDQLSSPKYEELLGILIDYKWTFEDHLLDNINQKIHILGRILKYMSQKKADKYHESISYNVDVVHYFG